MAADDKFPDSHPDSDADSRPDYRQPDDEEKQFVDRDDDGGFNFSDRDVDDDHPRGGTTSGDSAPDPGYAAFASELDDPLADWPSPDASLEDLPEVRMQEDAANSLDSELQDLAAAAATEAPAEAPKVEPHNAFSTPPGDLAFNDYTDDDTDEDPFAQDQVDADGPTADQISAESPLPGYESSPEPGESSLFEPVATPEPEIAAETLDFPEIPEPPEENEFVDDFLNDLDPPEDERLERESASFDLVEPATSAAEIDSAELEGSRDVEIAGASRFAGPGADTGSAVDDIDSNLSSPPAGPPEDSTSEKRSMPYVMIGIVVLALALLGFGGYGVVQQRSALQDEIRDLRAQLATTLTPDEADAERERQRQVELVNESLSAEVEALTAENAELGNQLQLLEKQLAEQATSLAEASQAARESAQAAERQAREAAARQERTTRATATAPAVATAGGPWFVNFGSYAQKSVADRWVGELNVNEGQVVVQTATAAGKTLYRVRVVGLVDQDQAERVATALERRYQLPRLWVGKN